MRYVYLDDAHLVREIIPAFVDTFPGVPINKRYSKAFLSHCLPVEDFVHVEQGMKYLPLRNCFVYPLRALFGSYTTAYSGMAIDIPVHFSEDVELTAEADIPLTVSDNVINIEPQLAGEYKILIHAKSDMQTIDMTLTLKVSDEVIEE